MRKKPRRSQRGRCSDEQQDHPPESIPRLRGRRRGHSLTGWLRRDRGAPGRALRAGSRWSRQARMQPARVILTEEAEHRVQLQTTLVRPHGADVSVDHAALVYDKKGKPWVFTVIGPQTYVRAAVGIKEVTRTTW